jgi:hypothetical protein
MDKDWTKNTRSLSRARSDPKKPDNEERADWRRRRRVEVGFVDDGMKVNRKVSWVVGERIAWSGNVVALLGGFKKWTDERAARNEAAAKKAREQAAAAAAREQRLNAPGPSAMARTPSGAESLASVGAASEQSRKVSRIVRVIPVSLTGRVADPRGGDGEGEGRPRTSHARGAVRTVREEGLDVRRSAGRNVRGLQAVEVEMREVEREGGRNVGGEGKGDVGRERKGAG